MKKMAKFGISFLTLGVLFSIVLGSSATAQAQIAVAILYEDEKAPQWNPANNDGSTFPYSGPGPLYGIAQGFGTRIERGTGLNGTVGGDIDGCVQIVASSITRRSGTSETADLGTGQAHGSILITNIIAVDESGIPDCGSDVLANGRFSGEIDLTNVEVFAIGTISGRYHLHGGGLNLNGALSGIFFFPIWVGYGYIYADGQPVTEFVIIPGLPPLPKVKLVAELFD